MAGIIYPFQTIMAVIITVGVVYALRRVGGIAYIEETIANQGAKLNAHPNRNLILVGICLVLAVVLVLSVSNVVTCYFNPTCYGWPIRPFPPDYFNQSNITKVIGVDYLAELTPSAP